MSDRRKTVIVAEATAVRELAEHWSGAWARSEGSLYLTPEWVLSLWESHYAMSGVEFVCCYTGGHLTSVFPLVRRAIRKFGINYLEVAFLTNVYGENHNELVSFPCSQQDTECLLEAVSARAWDIVSLTSVPDGSPSLATLESVAKARGLYLYRENYASSPYLVMGDTWEAFLAARSSNFRSEMRRKWSKGKSAGLVVTEIRHAEEVPVALTSILTIEERSWKHRVGTSIGVQRDSASFYRIFLPLAARRGWLRAYLVHLDGQPVAYDMGVVLQNKYYMLKTGFDEAYGHLSPGIFLRQYVIRGLIDSGVKEHDFLGGAEPYKLRWTSLTRPHFNVYVCNTRRLRSRAFSIAKSAQQALQGVLPPRTRT